MPGEPSSPRPALPQPGYRQREGADAPASRSVLLSRSPRRYFCSFSRLYNPQVSSEPGSSAAIGLHDIISALTRCFSTQPSSPERYSKMSTSARKANQSLQSSASFFSTSSPAHVHSVLFISQQRVGQLCSLPGHSTNLCSALKV